MILDIPSGDDFRLAADDLLNLAWDNATTLLLDRIETAELMESLTEDGEGLQTLFARVMMSIGELQCHL